jgi:hypothetical protein
MNILKCKVISILLIIFLFSVLYSGCIEQNGNNNQNEISFQEKIMNLDLSTIALTSLDVELNQVSSNHITEPRDFENAAGAGKTWYVLEQYQSMFTTESTSTPSTPQDPKESVVQVITKLESIEKAQEFMPLKIVNLIEDNGYSELKTETIGNSSFYLKKLLDDSEFEQYLCYFSFYNIIINVGGVSTNSFDIYEYAQIIEQKINDFLY